MNTKFNIGDDVNVISDGKIPHSFIEFNPWKIRKISIDSTGVKCTIESEAFGASTVFYEQYLEVCKDTDTTKIDIFLCSKCLNGDIQYTNIEYDGKRIDVFGCNKCNHQPT